MKLSDNFSLMEFTKSQTAERKGIENNPNEIHTIAMAELCLNVLERVRSAFGKPVMINSGSVSYTHLTLPTIYSV